MNERALNHLLLVALSALSLATAFGGGVAPAPAPTPGPHVGPDLRGVFASREQAAQAAALCGQIARTLEYDGQQPAPVYRTALDAEDLRVNLRRYQLLGGSYGERFGQAAGAWLEQHLGTDGGELARAKWVEAFRALAASCEREASLW